MRWRSSQFVVIGFLTAALCASISTARAWADPIVVTSGGLELHTSDPLIFLLVGEGFAFPGFNSNLTDLQSEFGTFRTCCHFGEPIDMSARVSRLLGNGQNVVFQGVTYPQVYWGGELRFDAPSVTMPPAWTLTTLVAPFELSGQLSAFATPALNGTPLFSTALVGTGVASLGLLPTGMGDLDYTINSSLAATPEPASLILMGSGLAGAAIVRSRKRRRTA